ncbi:MAG: Betaine-aldehyde dehydrogenase [Rhodospirillales bacterium]|nr:Betaine-aldehyde dehydrogenase [Rhodospirillales bacterium]
MGALDAFSALSGKLMLGSQFRRSDAGSGFDVIDPATEDRVGQIPDATETEVEEAVRIANEAQRKWRKVNALRRAELLHEVAHELKRLQPLIAEMLTREMGKPYKESFDECAWSITAIDYYAEIARHDAGKVIGPAVDGQFHFTVKDPLGTCVIIMPFNYPLCLLCWQAAAALACGNAVIVKPSELTTLTTLQFLEAFKHLPEGLVQCMPGGARVAQQLVAHPDTHMVAFTGGIETGRIVAQACASQYKRCLVESSGNDPFIVTPSAPLDIAARGAVFGAYLNCGQVCAAAERFYVHEKIHDEFVARVTQETRKVRIGNGLDKVDMGPLVSQRQREKYEGMLRRAVEQGAKVEIGGSRPAAFNKGWFVDATVLSNVTPDMEIMNDETFGPVLPVCRVKSFDEAIELANRSRYGLGSTVYTRDLEESMRAVNEIEAGMVWVNAPLLDNDAGPFGGRKQSGMGRQLGSEGLDTFRHTKLAMIDPASAPHDFWWFPYSDREAFPKAGRKS